MLMSTSEKEMKDEKIQNREEESNKNAAKARSNLLNSREFELASICSE